MQQTQEPEPEPAAVAAEPEPTPEPPSPAVEEYARIHEISDLEVAEFRLNNPDYAKENPYVPTPEDIEHYERDFLERMYPEFKKTPKLIILK